MRNAGDRKGSARSRRRYLCGHRRVSHVDRFGLIVKVGHCADRRSITASPTIVSSVVGSEKVAVAINLPNTFWVQAKSASGVQRTELVIGVTSWLARGVSHEAIRPERHRPARGVAAGMLNPERHRPATLGSSKPDRFYSRRVLNLDQFSGRQNPVLRPWAARSWPSHTA
jgi:hypothetical protein